MTPLYYWFISHNRGARQGHEKYSQRTQSTVNLTGPTTTGARYELIASESYKGATEN